MLSEYFTIKLFFDILITLGIFMTAFPAVILLYSTKKRKKSWETHHPRTTYTIALLLLCATFLLVWGSFFEPRLIIITKKTIDLPHIKEPIKIALISDFQIGTYKKTKWTRNVVKKIIQLNPDIVLIGGDNVDNVIYKENEFVYLEPLKLLTKKYPTYAIHGNHEYGISGGKSIDNPAYQVANVTQKTKEGMEAIGIQYLVNELEEITINNQSFYLFGGDSYWAKKLDFSILATRKKDIDTLGLIHNPSFIFEDFPHDVDLFLSGHTHGGQIRLPFIGPLGRVDDILPTTYYKGLNNLDPTTKLFVTSGIGESGTRARLFNPPEIALITIK